MAWEDRTWWMMMIDLRSPAESPKIVLTHEHVTCTLDAGGDAPQLTSKETRPTARYARQSTGAFADPKTLHSREGPRQGAQRLWAALGRFARP